MDVTRMENTLGRYQGLVTAGLAFIVVFAVSVMGVMLWQSFRLGQQSEQIKDIATTTHESLCTFQADLQHRYVQGVKFLRDNPEGFASIDANTLQRSLDSQKSTLDALRRGGLECS